MNYAGLKEDVLAMLTEKSDGKYKYFSEFFFSMIASKSDVLTALIHLGYLDTMQT